MTAAKKPQDHEGKKPTVKEVEGGKSVTFPELKNGDAKPLTVTVTTDALDDFELLDDLRAIDVDKKASHLPSLLRRLVGDQYPAVLDALRAPDGRVKIEAGTKFIKDLFGALNPN